MKINEKYKSDKIIMKDFGAVIGGTVLKNDLKEMIKKELPNEGLTNPDSIFIHYFKNSIPALFNEATKLNVNILDYSSLNKVKMKTIRVPEFEDPILIPEDGSVLFQNTNLKYVVVFTNFKLYQDSFYSKNSGQIYTLYIQVNAYVWDVVNKQTIAYGKAIGSNRYNNFLGNDIEEWNGAVGDLLKSAFRETPLYYYY